MIRVHLSDDHRQHLHLLARREVGRVAQRLHFILLSDQGHSPPQIAALWRYTPATVRQWLDRYLTQGLPGLYDRPRPGRPLKLTPQAQEELNATVAQSPVALGESATVWTVGRLARRLQPLVGKLVHGDTVRRWLHRLGWRWRKPKHVSPRKEDPHREAKLAALHQAVQEVKTAPPETAPILLAQDESTFSWLPVLRRMWMRRGQQAPIPTPGQAKKITCLGALNLVTGAWLSCFAPHARSLYFEGFLEQLVAAYPGRRIYLLLDNASIHRAKRILQWLEQHPQMVPLWLPTYSSLELNPVERLWGEIKQRVAADHCYASLGALQQALTDFFERDLTKEKALQVAGKVNPLRRAA